MTLMNDLIEEISMGPFGSDIKVENFVSEGIPVLNGSNISGVSLTDVFENYVTVEKADSLKKANAQRGDIVITHRGTLGQIAYIPQNSKFNRYIISQSQFKVRLKKDIVNPIYFTYYFHTNEGQRRLLSFKNHVGVPALAQATTNFRQLEFPYISIYQQNQIAKVLSDLDAKIELNNKINAELEAMAKLIYDYWFVQFDFPHEFKTTKTDEYGKVTELVEVKPYKSSGGKIVWNAELNREIPEGWEVKSLDYFDLYQPKTISEKEMTEVGFHVFGANGIVGKYSDYNHAEVETVVTCRGNSCGNIIRTLPKSWITGNAMVIKTKNQNIVPEFIFQMLQWVGIHKVISGSGQPQITRTNLQTLKFVLPTEKCLIQYKEFVSPICNQRINLIEENQKLAELRDWLLPMLMNGQVKVN